MSERIGALGPPIYVGLDRHGHRGGHRATGAIPGMLVVAAGAASNLLAIVANGGYMPVERGRRGRARARRSPSAYSNSVHRPGPGPGAPDRHLRPAAWLPFANVFSVGDVLIGLGIVDRDRDRDALEAGAPPPPSVRAELPFAD